MGEERTRRRDKRAPACPAFARPPHCLPQPCSGQTRDCPFDQAVSANDRSENVRTKGKIKTTGGPAWLWLYCNCRPRFCPLCEPSLRLQKASVLLCECNTHSHCSQRSVQVFRQLCDLQGPAGALDLVNSPFPLLQE